MKKNVKRILTGETKKLLSLLLSAVLVLGLVLPVLKVEAVADYDVDWNFYMGYEKPTALLLDELETKVDELLKQIQSDIFEKARAHRDAHTYVATNYDEFKDIIANKPGFVKAMWCGDRACEDKIKEETTATSRCMPFAQEHLSDVCVCCGRPAKKMVYWGKAY